MAVRQLETGPLVVGLAECKAALRLERDDEDALIAGHIRTAMALCESFIGQWLIEREAEQRLAGDLSWQRLRVCPVTAVTAVQVGGHSLAEGWESEIAADGTGWVRLLAVPSMAPSGVVVRFRAGLAADWNDVPEPLRAGVVRLVSHFFTHRDAADAGPPPAAVAALAAHATGVMAMTFDPEGEIAGMMVERVTIERWQGGRDAAADAVGTWMPVDDVAAAVTPDGALSAARGGDTARSDRRWRVLLRRRDDIDLAARLRWQGRSLRILAIETHGRQRAHLLLLCEGLPA
jgi:uncharacterized phiE125 gp8 family phage protein